MTVTFISKKRSVKLSTERKNHALLLLLSCKINVITFHPSVVKTETVSSISDKGDSLQIWRAAENKLNGQSQTAVMICSCHIGVGHGG